MWEAIARNRRNSRLLMVGLLVLLVGLGYLVGFVWDPEAGGPIGVGIALVYWIVLMAVALAGGDQALLLGVRARPVRKEDAPRLWNVVEEMTIASGLGSMPRIYLIESDAPNAFAAGLRPDRAVIAVTSGLVKLLNRSELQGVIAHEIGHIRNLDVRFMTLAAVTVGSIAILSDLFRRTLWFHGGRRRSNKVDPRIQIAAFAAGVILSVLAPICARMLYLACSRRREYLADATAAQLTRYPEGLASALEKITAHAHLERNLNRAVAPMYIVNPLEARGGGGLFSTHPPVETRIRVLRSMAGGAGYVDFDNAYRRLVGRSCLGAATLREGGHLEARPPEAEPREAWLARIREVDELLGRLAGFVLLACPCGLNIRAPRRPPGGAVRCPRCGRRHEVPREEAPAAAPETPDRKGRRAFSYQRRAKGWETFRCPCGKTQQLSPAFRSDHLVCSACSRRIRILPAEAAPKGERAETGG